MIPATQTSDVRASIPPGVIVLTLFGLAWWLVGASAAHGTAKSVLITLGPVAAAGILAAGWRRAPRSSAGPAWGEVRRRFNLINATQWVAIIVAIGAADIAGVPSWIPALIAIIVGIHFLPLATLFDLPAYRVTAGLLIAIGAAGLTLGIADATPATLQSVVGLSAGLTLWGTWGTLLRSKP
jgi:hypothetical protein